MRRKIALLLCMLFSSLLFAQENLWDDSSFEKNGTKGDAHSGEAAGVFSFNRKNRWEGFMHRELNVEPFAIYEATGWVKIMPDTDGTVYALYTYGWYSFGWGFMFTGKPQKNVEGWQKVTSRFYVPDAKVDFLPLVVEGGSKANVKVDDVSIVKIMSAEEHIASLQKKQKLNYDERRLLVRYYLTKNDIASIKAIRKNADDVTKADIDFLFWEKHIEPENAKSQIADIIRFATSTPDGIKQLNKIFATTTPKVQAEAMVRAFRLGNANDNCRKAWSLMFENKVDVKDIYAREFNAMVEKQKEIENIIQAAFNENVLPDDLLASWKQNQAAWQNELKARSYGQRTIVLAGAPLKAATHAIVLPEQPTPSETRAADELELFLEKISGEALPIISETAVAAQIPILIGRSANLAKHGFAVDYAKLGLEGIHIETSAKTHALLLAGGQRGVLYAVYTFLEDYLGCRWFAKDCSVIPNQKGTVTLDSIKKVFVPALEQRDANFTCCHDTRTSVRNKLNGAAVYGADATWGGHISYKGFVHTFNSLVPPSVYGASHPEYYSEINGRRLTERSQLCLTNPEVKRIATDTVRSWIKESPTATIISVSQNDWHNYCTCKKCKALAEEEGSQSGPLLHFVNAIAAEIGKDHPEKIIDTLAYQYTRKPPKHVKPLPNVAVRLCSIECCFTHPLEDDPFNKTFVDDIIGWSKICNRLHIWDYVINYRHSVMPFPNFRVLKPNIQFFIKHSVTSIFEEANYYSDAGELAELRSYVMFKLLWDPDYDTDKAIREFTDAYYGAAAPYIREYLTLLHDNVCSRSDIHVRIYADPSYYLNDLQMLKKSTELFQKAMEAVKDDKQILHHVEVAYLPIIYTKQMLNGTTLFANNGKLAAKKDVKNDELGFFARVAKEANLKRISESASNTTEAWLATRKTSNNAFTIINLTNGRLSLDIIPALGGRIWRAKLDGRNILRTVGDDKSGFQPDSDGYEEYANTGYRTFGFYENFVIKNIGKYFVDMRATLKDGVIADRRIELLTRPGKPAFKVTTHYTASQNLPARSVRVHPVFNVPDPRKATLEYLQKDGKKRAITLAERLSEGSHQAEGYLNGTETPYGNWQISFTTEDGKPCTIENRFDIEDVDFCYFHIDTTEKRINLEQWSKAVPFSPTSGPTLSNTYIIKDK